MWYFFRRALKDARFLVMGGKPGEFVWPWPGVVLSCSVGQSVAVRDDQGINRSRTLTSWVERGVTVVCTGDAAARIPAVAGR